MGLFDTIGNWASDNISRGRELYDKYQPVVNDGLDLANDLGLIDRDKFDQDMENFQIQIGGQAITSFGGQIAETVLQRYWPIIAGAVILGVILISKKG